VSAKRDPRRRAWTVDCYGRKRASHDEVCYCAKFCEAFDILRTKRHLRILKLVAQGMTPSAAARRCGYSAPRGHQILALSVQKARRAQTNIRSGGLASYLMFPMKSPIMLNRDRLLLRLKQAKALERRIERVKELKKTLRRLLKQIPQERRAA